jgi:hypothetical protein
MEASIGTNELLKQDLAASFDFPFNPIRILSAFAPVFVFHFAAAITRHPAPSGAKFL